MKKLFITLLALVLCVSLFACGEDQANESKNSEKNDSNEESVVSENSTASESSESGISEDNSDTESEISIPEMNLPAVAINKLSGNAGVFTRKYANNFFGINAEITEDWYFYPDSGIKDEYGSSVPMVDKTSTKALSDNELIFDMIAKSSSTNGVIQVQITRIGVDESFFSENKEIYLDPLAATLTSSLKLSGAKNIKQETTTVKIDNKKVDCIDISARISGRTLYLKTIVIVHEGYSMNISISNYDTDLSEEVLGFFSMK